MAALPEVLDTLESDRAQLAELHGSATHLG